METHYRNLTADEVAQLERHGNWAADWQKVLVAVPFCIDCLRGNTFDGEVRLGTLEVGIVHDGDLTQREGIYNSTLCNCTLGDHATVHNVKMLSDYRIGDNAILFNIEEMTCTTDPKMVDWLEPMNENGGRSVLPFGGMTVGDAYMWARYRGRHEFVKRLEQFTYDTLQTEDGCYGRIGDCCTIKNTKTVHNVIVNSSANDKTRIDGCIALSDGVVGYGCTLEYGCIAVRFLLGEHVHLEFGIRLNDTVVGDNSTLARGEVGCSIIFPAHEQHHNNSFLIAALVMGQSNVAAGATIGSNHNSRTADGELCAGRGFWPGLCSSFKHSSRFASYCLLAKGDYPAEMDIPLPFALVSNNTALDRLEVMPAYWWMYNMYAMDRNSRKFAARDKRVTCAQHIEFSPLAPDTAEEILHAMTLLRSWMTAAEGGTVYAEGLEKGKRQTVVLKAAEGMRAYEDMLLHYAMSRLVTAYGGALPPQQATACRHWVNIGGQLVTQTDMEQLISDTQSGVIGSWHELHQRMDTLWQCYPSQVCAHAYMTLCSLIGAESIDEPLWQTLTARHHEILADIERRRTDSRRKDDTNTFRRMTCWDDAEYDAVFKN